MLNSEAAASAGSVINSWSWDEGFTMQEGAKVMRASCDKCPEFRPLFWALEIHRHIRYTRRSLGSPHLVGNQVAHRKRSVTMESR